MKDEEMTDEEMAEEYAKKKDWWEWKIDWM